MKQKKLPYGWLFSLLLLLAGTATQAHTQSEHLRVYTLGGTKSFALNETRKITFEGQNMNIHPTDGDAAEVSLSDVLKLTFELMATAPWIGTEEVAVSDSNVRVYPNGNGGLTIESVTEIATVNLFDLQGRLLQSIAPRSLSATLNLPYSPSGVYVVQTLTQQGASTHKIVLR